MLRARRMPTPRQRQFSRLLLGAGLMLGLGAPRARAADPDAAPPVDLTWDAPADCPSRDVILQGVQAVLGRSPGEQRRVTASARLRPTPEGLYRVELTSSVDGSAGQRALDAESCSAAADAVTLILALLVNPEASLAFESSEGAAVATPPVAPVEPTAAPQPVPTQPASPSHDEHAAVADPRWALGIAFALDHGLAPGWGEGLSVSVAHALSQFRFEAFGSGWLRETATSATFPDAGARVQHFAFGLAVGYGFRLQQFRVGPVLGVSADWLLADGFGGVQAFDQSTTVISPFAGGRADWFLARWFSLGLTAAAKVPTSRSKFVVTAQPSGTTAGIFEVKPVAFEGRVGCEVHFP